MSLRPRPFTVFSCPAEYRTVFGATMLTTEQLEAIRQFDTCTIANAIEHFRIRLRNEGFTRPGLRCMTGEESRLLGYAATSRVRFSNPSVTGTPYLERTDWWEVVDQLPLPRIAVI